MGYGTSFAKLLAFLFWPGQVRSQNYDVISGIASDRIFRKIVISATSLAAIDRNGDIKHDLGNGKATSDLWHCILILLRSSEVNDPVWPHVYLQWLIWLFLGGRVLGCQDRIRGYFSTQTCLLCLFTRSNVVQGHWPNYVPDVTQVWEAEGQIFAKLTIFRLYIRISQKVPSIRVTLAIGVT